MSNPHLDRDFKLKANKIVKIVNSGDRDVYEMYDGDVYHFPPKSWLPIRAEIAWIWFGHQDLRDDPVAWQDELTRIADRVGPNEWAYRKDGKFYCADFGAPGEFYTMPQEKKVPSVVAQSLDTLEEAAREFVSPPDPSILSQHDSLEDFTSEVRVAPRKSHK